VKHVGCLLHWHSAPNHEGGYTSFINRDAFHHICKSRPLLSHTPVTKEDESFSKEIGYPADVVGPEWNRLCHSRGNFQFGFGNRRGFSNFVIGSTITTCLLWSLEWRALALQALVVFLVVLIIFLIGRAVGKSKQLPASVPPHA
jgi:hypothetical protein